MGSEMCIRDSNAGIQHVAPIEKFPISNWEEVISVNLTAYFHTIASVIEGMRSRGFGRKAESVITAPESMSAGKKSPPARL